MKLVVVGINHKDTPLEIREKGAFIKRTVKAVSYTHLDVYKRQVQHQ